MVKDVARRLRQRGVASYLDVLDQELPGRPFDVIAARIKKAATVAVFIGGGGLGPFQRLEVTLAVIQAVKRGMRVVPVLLPGAGDIPELELFLECFSWIDLRQGIVEEQVERLARVCTVTPGSGSTASAAIEDYSLSAIIRRAQQRLVISGHTLDKFVGDEEVRDELRRLAFEGKRVTIIQLNPDSPYAAAHRPFHELESTSPAKDQHLHTLGFFQDLFQAVNPAKRDSIDVSLSNYMPRFRTVIVDDAVFVYHYMYGGDVAEHPDLRLEPSVSSDDQLRRRILYSTLSMVQAPETIPFIRCGQIFTHWRQTNISKWTDWTASERSRHKLTHEYYTVRAKEFHARYGNLDELEDDVKRHLDLTRGSTLVLGCGSGKEVEHLSIRRPKDHLCGVDSSDVAIRLARQRCRPTDVLMLGDFYDLDVPAFLGGRQFESAVANAALVHLLNRDDIDQILGKIWRRLVDGGRLFLRCLYKEQDGKPIAEEQDKWTPRWFVYYSPAELAQRCQNAGFYVDREATERIAESCGMNAQISLSKGFRHERFSGVWWSSILARKQA